VKVEYRYVPGYVITAWEAAEVVRAWRSGARELVVTVDMGLAKVVARFEGGSVVLGDSQPVPIEEIERVREGFAYKIMGRGLVRLDLYDSGRYYKLKPVARHAAPTLEISGIQMHRAIGIDPWADSRLKVMSLGDIAGARVLDVCTGLGYTAIAEVLRGASRVVTVEADPNVLEISRYNPWSRGLEDRRVEIVLSDATSFVKGVDSESFDAVLHDPPRISIAGELYGLEFYRELFRVLRPGGRLFHYVGEPGKHSNVDFLKGVKRRLEHAGFITVRWIDRAKGFAAVKPN
jgi:predicted methyltransferase